MTLRERYVTLLRAIARCQALRARYWEMGLVRSYLIQDQRVQEFRAMAREMRARFPRETAPRRVGRQLPPEQRASCYVGNIQGEAVYLIPEQP